MATPPSHIFVVRHGNRLDAADKKWHLSSPTPYDPPLTYGGFQQARQVGNQIWSILEQAKLEYDVSREESNHTKKRKRFKVVIHSSPFLRCVQTSVGISSGLAQSAPGSIYDPSDVIVPAAPPAGALLHSKSAILRLDSFLGEWLCPEYFEAITPPPGPALMMGGAKAELLRKGDFSSFDEFNIRENATSTSALWNSSPGLQPADSSDRGDGTQRSRQLMPKNAYIPPRPNYAVSSSRNIPDGFVAHARDSCVVVDYQWDSMRAPLDFGDGGQLGEEWPAMHKRFRKGLKQLVNWYCINEAAAEPVTTPITPVKSEDGRNFDIVHDDEEVETVIIIVSHGAGCNALIGAITHQPVLMDVGIASITLAERKAEANYPDLLFAHKNDPAAAPYGVSMDLLYEIKVSASTEHLQSTSSNPNSAKSTRSPSLSNSRNNGGPRGRTSTFGSLGGAVMSPFTYSDSFSAGGSRSNSASASTAPFVRRGSGASRPARAPISAIAGPGSAAGTDGSVNGSSTMSTPSFGLWSPAPSTLRLLTEDSESDVDDLDSALPDFDKERFKTPIRTEPSPVEFPAIGGTLDAQKAPSVKPLGTPTGPILAAPIKLQTNFLPSKPIDEVKITQLGDGYGGLWGLPRPPDDAELFRDMTQSKRRWTVNERS